MADDKLARVTGAAGALEKRLDPQVLSKANPAPDHLMDARAYVNSNGKALFQQHGQQGHSIEWLVDQLAVRLVAWWQGGNAAQAQECAQYLVDEYHQLGEGIHLVEKATGKVVITLTDDDIYQPAPVARHGGGMATPLKRIRPDLEAAIITWTFEKDREARIVNDLAARGHQTTLLREEGDPRLLIATRKGRSQIVKELTDFSPKALLDRCGGTAGAFLRHFDLVTELDQPGDAITWSFEGQVSARSVMGIQDPTTANLSYSRKQTLRGALPQGWVRHIASHLATFVHHEREITEGPRLGDWIEATTAQAQFWVAPPELIIPMRRLNSQLVIIPVDRTPCIGFTKPKVGVIVVPEAFSAESHEMFDRWEAVANLDYKVWFDPDAIVTLAVSGIEYQATVETRP